MQTIKVNSIPADENDSALLGQTTSESGSTQIRIRKATEGKDIFFEVWNNNGLASTLKINEKVTKVYNDVVFGGMQWSADESKVCFIGETPEIATYKNPWDQPEKKTDESEETKDKKEEKEEHWQEEKFLYENDFGEALVGKKNPALF
jgi:hypothetical protein